MKIKNIVILTLTGLAAAIGLRFAELFIMYDSGTGFFRDNGMLSWIIYAMLLLMLVTETAVCAKKGSLNGRKEESVNLFSAFATLAAGLVVLACCFYMYSEIFVYQTPSEVTSVGISLKAPFFFVSVVFGLFTSFSSIRIFSGKNVFSRMPALYLISVLWSLFMILYVFIHYSISSLITENIWIILSACILALYFLFWSHFETDVNEKGRYLAGMEVTGSISCIMLCAYSLPNIVMYIMQTQYKNMLPLWFNSMAFAIGIMILATITAPKFEFVKRDVEKPAKRYKKI
jgi:hypothetical protein